MMLLLAATMAFPLPLGVIALVAAVAGFFFRPLQPLILMAMAWSVGWFCNGLAVEEMFAPAMVLPVWLALLVAICASIAVRRGMEHGYRLEAGRAGASE